MLVNGVEEPIVEEPRDEFQNVFDGITSGTEEASVTEILSTPITTVEPVAPTENVVTDIVTPVTPPVVTPTVEQPTDYKVLYEQELQKTRSWEGRLSASARDIKELKDKLAAQELVTQVTAAQPSTSGVADASLIDLDDPVIKKFVAEMGDDFIQPLDAYMQKRVEHALKPILDRLTLLDKIPDLEKQVAGTVEERTATHYSAILEAHKDVAELLQENAFNVYIESLPYKEAIEKKKILESGTTAKVIQFITEFKKATGRDAAVAPPQTPNPQPVPKSDVDAATVVKHTSSFIPKGKADVNDFQGAFAEAVNTR